MRLGYVHLLALLAATLGCAALPSAAEELTLPLDVQISYTDVRGQPLTTLDRDTPFRLVLRYARSDGAPLPPDLAPRGWLRPVSDTNGTCDAAARQFTLSRHSLPYGTIDLSSTLIGVAAKGGGFSVVDPSLNLASANMIAAAKLDSAPDWLETDAGGGRFIATMSAAGQVLSIDAFTGDITVIATGLAEPAKAFAARDGKVWIHEAGTGRLLEAQGDDVSVKLEGVTGPVTADPSRDTLAAVTAQGVKVTSTVEVKTDTYTISQPITALALGHYSPSRVAVLQENALVLLGDDKSTIDLPTPADTLLSDPHGRWLAAFEAGSTAHVTLIDLHTRTIKQTIAVSAAVTELAFAHQMLFVLTADQMMIRAVDLSTDTSGPAPVRRLSFGQTSRGAMPVSDGLIAALGEDHGVIMVHQETYTGFLVHPIAAKTDMPPMKPVRLRGGVPVRIASLVRRFDAIGPDQFETFARLGDARQYELVLKSGVSSRPACVILPSKVSDDTLDSAGQWRLAQSVNGVFLLDQDDVPIADTDLQLLLTGLRSAHREVVQVRTNELGRIETLALSMVPRPVAISVFAVQSHAVGGLVLD
ncbi:MAG: hypothetical protein WBA90_14805 [Albidovulum sp.]